MDQQTHASHLRFLNAADVKGSVVDFHNLDVRGPDAGKLGTLDGFIIDEDRGRALFLVIDSGGWFASPRFLLPVGHAQLASDGSALQVDVTQDVLSGYPEFDETRFREASDDDLSAYDVHMAAVCCPDDPLLEGDATWPESYRARRHYAEPAWWHGSTVASASRDTAGARASPPPDESPHSGGRAQPGDVLGIETAGERTGLGDTAEDEDERRRKAIESAPRPHSQ